jgi:hypothetical protein
MSMSMSKSVMYILDEEKNNYEEALQYEDVYISMNEWLTNIICYMSMWRTAESMDEDMYILENCEDRNVHVDDVDENEDYVDRDVDENEDYVDRDGDEDKDEVDEDKDEVDEDKDEVDEDKDEGDEDKDEGDEDKDEGYEDYVDEDEFEDEEKDNCEICEDVLVNNKYGNVCKKHIPSYALYDNEDYVESDVESEFLEDVKNEDVYISQDDMDMYYILDENVYKKDVGRYEFLEDEDIDMEGYITQ